MVVRDSSVGATRQRYVEAVAMTLARDYRLDNIRSVALTAPGRAEEWMPLKEIISYWLGKSALSVVVYEDYLPGIHAEENFG